MGFSPKRLEVLQVRSNYVVHCLEIESVADLAVPPCSKMLDKMMPFVLSKLDLCPISRISPIKYMV